MADSPLEIKDIPLTGKLITSVNSAVIGENFKTLKNLRYANTNPESVGGHSKINTTALSSFPKVRSGIHFRKEDETHTIVQAYNSGETASSVLQNTTAIPDQGDYEATALHSDSGTGLGRFSEAPTGEIAYCNSEETLLWAGDELRCSGFFNYGPDGDFSYDFTDQISNSLTTDFATIGLSAGGIDSNVMLLLHLDNNVTDSSPTTPHTVTNANVTFSSSDFIFGTHSAVFNGTNAKLTAPNNADFDFSGGSWTIDARVKVDDLATDQPIYERAHEMNVLAFTSGGTYEIMEGDTIDGQLSMAEALIEFVELTSGTWAGGDAAGNLYFRTADQTGTFQAENLNVGASSNVATIAGDSSSAGFDYFIIEIHPNGSLHFHIETVHDTGEITLSSPAGIISAGSWYHIEVSESGDNYYLFVDGILRDYESSTVRPAVDTSVVNIGFDASDSAWFKGKIDELRVSNIARHTADFSVPAAAYTSDDVAAYFYIGAIRPLDGIKFYVGTANTSAGSLVAQYWDGSTWADVSSLSDGTSSGGISLAQTGTVTFDNTDGLAKLKYLNQAYLYWYRVYVTAADDTTTIYRVTLSAAMQSVKDIWDGTTRECLSFQVYVPGYYDNTLNVKEEDFSSANTATFANLNGLLVTQHFVAGFAEKQTGLLFTMIPGGSNSAGGVIATVSYWDGSAFVSVGDLDDGTINDGIGFAKSGVMSWSVPDQEFKTKISKEFELYYYKVSFSAQLSNLVGIDFVGGIPAQTPITGYKFPVYAQDRLWLCSEQANEKNAVIVSAFGTSVVFNGTDTTKFNFGDNTEVVAGTSIYLQVGSSLYDIFVICKRNETWIVSGNNPENWIKFKASHRIGCVAPLTMAAAHLNTEVIAGLNRHVVMWQAEDGIYIFDGRTFMPIYSDIDDLFDKRNPNGINRDKIGDSVGFFDDQNQEYHWLFASGSSTTLNREFVYDMRRQKWFEIERPTGLQYGMRVVDSVGNSYNYGFVDTGYTYRLENGNDFDGSSITSTLETGDLYLGGSPFIESIIRAIRLTMVAKTTTANSVTLSHFKNTGTAVNKTIEMSPSDSGYSVSDPVMTDGLGPFVTHRFKLEMTADDEIKGFEPLFLSLAHKLVRIAKS